MNQHSSPLLCTNRLVLACLFGCAGLLFACEKDPEPMSTNNVIKGGVSLYNNSDDEPLTGIKVTACGPYGNHSTITDEYGKFFIDNLGNGTYWIDYSKEGYGSLRQYNLRVLEGDTLQVMSVHLFRNPELTVVPDFKKAYVDYRDRFGPPTEFLHIETNIKVQQYHRLDMMLFLDTSDKVGYDRSAFIYPGSDDHFTDEGLHAICIEKLYLPFTSGTKVYIIGYPCNPGEYQDGYIDIYLGKRLFSTLDESRPTNVISFIMP